MFCIHCGHDPDIVRKLDHILTRLNEVEKRFMAQLDDLKAAVADEDADIDQVLALVSSEVAQITDLQNQLAAAIAAGAPDLSSIIADVQAKTAALKAVLPPPPPPPAGG